MIAGYEDANEEERAELLAEMARDERNTHEEEERMDTKFTLEKLQAAAELLKGLEKTATLHFSTLTEHEVEYFAEALGTVVRRHVAQLQVCGKAPIIIFAFDGSLCDGAVQVHGQGSRLATVDDVVAHGVKKYGEDAVVLPLNEALALVKAA